MHAGARAERAFGTHVRRADTLAPTVLAHTAEPRHALPFSPLRAKPPLATPGKPRASRRHRPTASAHVGAAKATSARQLALGAVPTRPLAPAVIPSHATLPCKLQRGGSPESLSGRRGTDLDELYKEAPEPPRAHRKP